MFLIEQEGKEAAELLQTEIEVAHQSRVFAADIPNRWRIYKAIFEAQEEIAEYGGEVIEVNPEDPDELRRAYLDMKRAGFRFAED
jgi:hypothetical protein